MRGARLGRAASGGRAGGVFDSVRFRLPHGAVVLTRVAAKRIKPDGKGPIRLFFTVRLTSRAPGVWAVAPGPGAAAVVAVAGTGRASRADRALLLRRARVAVACGGQAHAWARVGHPRNELFLNSKGRATFTLSDYLEGSQPAPSKPKIGFKSGAKRRENRRSLGSRQLSTSGLRGEVGHTIQKISFLGWGVTRTKKGGGRRVAGGDGGVLGLKRHSQAVALGGGGMLLHAGAGLPGAPPSIILPEQHRKSLSLAPGVPSGQSSPCCSAVHE